ncbi:hypothetical protein [Nonomuraea sp. KM90]|uniref:hypothetical protein n=1 Tax=Nonomuraea sp. KM90 TaxID=3457428 RepID=UPI003FCC9F33
MGVSWRDGLVAQVTPHAGVPVSSRYGRLARRVVAAEAGRSYTMAAPACALPGGQSSDECGLA